jgi:hypothetical protein
MLSQLLLGVQVFTQTKQAHFRLTAFEKTLYATACNLRSFLVSAFGGGYTQLIEGAGLELMQPI